jgi:hypothetical protein
MKKTMASGLVAIGLFALIVPSAPSANAQTVVLYDNFTFNGTTPCSSITSWNGDTDAYPEDMGGICLNQGDSYGGYGSFLDVPFQLGFLNNGYLAGCNPLAWSPKRFTIGNGTHNGDAFTVAGSTTCPYYTGEYGGASDNLLVGFNVVASYTVLQHRSCYRGRCITYFTNVLQGGTGTVEETRI